MSRLLAGCVNFFNRLMLSLNILKKFKMKLNTIKIEKAKVLRKSGVMFSLLFYNKMSNTL